jgi:hypothetical protein
MDLFLAVSQGTGLALATGLRPYLPPLLAGALARANAGIDFTGSDFAFLESVPFLAVLVALALLGMMVDRRLPGNRAAPALGGVAVVLAALLFAGSLSGEGHAWGAGIAAGAVCGLLAWLSGGAFIGGARERLSSRGEQASAGYLAFFADAVALLLALVAVFLSPLSYVALAFCVWTLLARRRRGASKYEGLRVLR